MGGKEQLYICACELSVASMSGCHCSKNPQKFLLHMRVRPLHVQSTVGQYCLIRGVKLAGWVSMLPHPMQDQKKMKDASQCSPFRQL